MDEPLWTREQVEAAFAARFAPMKRATSAASSHLARTPSSGLRTQPGRRSAAQSPKRHADVRVATCAWQRSPPRSPRQSSQVSSQQQPAPRQGPEPSSPARASSAADSDGAEEGSGDIRPPADRGPPQHQAVQTAPAAAQVFVCADLKGEHGLWHSTADAATQAEVEHEQVHALSGSVSQPGEQELAASEAAHSDRGTAINGVEAGEQDNASGRALPSEDGNGGACPSNLTSDASDGRQGHTAPADDEDHTQPAHEDTAGPDPQTTLALDVEADPSIGAGLNGKGDGQNIVADGDSCVAPDATVAGTDVDAALAPGGLQFAVAVADDGAAAEEPLPAASSSDSPATVAQLQEEPVAEPRREPYSLSEQALHDSEVQLQELAALATQLQQVRLQFPGTTSAPIHDLSPW